MPVAVGTTTWLPSTTTSDLYGVGLYGVGPYGSFATLWSNQQNQGTSANWLNQGNAIWAGNINNWLADPTATTWLEIA